MPERFDAGTGLVAIGAVLLIVSLFIDWFTPGGNAWAVFEIADIVLAGFAIAAIASIATSNAGLTRAMPAMAFAAEAVVAVQLIDQPPAARGSEIETGAWLALAATLLMAIGATMTMASISVTIAVRGRERRRRTPAIDVRDGEPTAGKGAPAAGKGAPAADEEQSAPAGGDLWRDRRRDEADAAPDDGDSGAPGAGARPPTRPEPADAERTTPAPSEPPDDPERTQTLDPVDRPGEGR